jgi:hypothetical protein
MYRLDAQASAINTILELEHATRAGGGDHFYLCSGKSSYLAVPDSPAQCGVAGTKNAA